MEISLHLATYEEGGPFGNEVTLASLQQTELCYSNKEAAEITQQDERPEQQLSYSEKIKQTQ